ncbi:MAG TPA: hypothetical protein VIM65_05710 [Cyclobacteriaceae bacterium]
MSKMTREEKLFRNESKVLDEYKRFNAEERSMEETKEALKALTANYENLLNQTRFLTWISGRLERKLQRTNRELSENNNTLQNTLNALTKAEASKSAYAIIYSVAIMLFVLEQFFVDPLIAMAGGNAGYGILIKLGIVLLLKVSEGVIEKKITKQSKLSTVVS